MGEVIARKAARERIMDDVETTRTRAAARAGEGNPWGVAEARLAPVLALWTASVGRAEAAKAAAAGPLAALAAADDVADQGVKAHADAIWNELGRPANDPVFELLFPGGASAYADAPIDEQPAMMRLLAELLEARLHPKLDAAAVAPRTTAIRAAADALDAALSAAREPRAKARLYDRMLTTIARVAHYELAKLKRFWKSEGLSEADIHAVIPDRARSYGVETPPGGGGTPSAPAPDGPS